MSRELVIMPVHAMQLHLLKTNSLFSVLIMVSMLLLLVQLL
jgi:hypothetical protein